MMSARVWMTSVAAVFAVVATSGAARADEGDPYFRVDVAPAPVRYRTRQAKRTAWYDLGLVRSQIAPTTIGAAGADPIVANTIRFGLAVKMTRNFYFGGDTDFGTISDTSTPAQVGGRSTTMPTTGYGDTLRGSTAAIRGLAGFMTSVGSISGAAELAAGYRIDTTDGKSLIGGQTQEEMVVEARGRLSMYVLPGVTIGAVAGVDLRDHRDVSLGFVIGLHPHAWDHSRI